MPLTREQSNAYLKEWKRKKRKGLPTTDRVLIDLAGLKFNRWTVLKRSAIKKGYWLCQCDCGTQKEIEGTKLRCNKTNSCGCYAKQRAKELYTTHGDSKSAEYNVWRKMQTRCFDAKSKSYSDYGARGITVCNRWLVYENFLHDMGRRPTPKHTIERNNNNGNYEKSNCSWATRDTQGNNKRNNIVIEYENVSCTAKEWSRILEINYNRFFYLYKIKGLTIKQIIDAKEHTVHTG